MTLCHFIRADGHPCAAPAGKDSQFCFHHDPARSLEAKKARLKGSEIARIKKLAGGETILLSESPLKPFALIPSTIPVVS